jgi:peptide deformylase
MADGLVEFMLERHGVGLAAPQVGESVRIFSVFVPPRYDCSEADGRRLNPEINEPLVMINPVLTTETGVQNGEEGCLSIPGVFAPVRRAYEVAVSFIDLRGRRRQLTVKGLVARAVQHELDHLNGVLFVDRVSPLKKISLAARLRRMKRAAEREIAGADIGG